MRKWQKTIFLGLIEPTVLGFAYSLIARDVQLPYFILGLVFLASLNVLLLWKLDVWRSQ